MKLKPLTREDCEVARHWRNECLATLRTPYFITEEMQSTFYDDVICSRNSPHRYWGISEDKTLIAMCGITDVAFENSIGEISLIVNPDYKRKGYGEKAVDLLLNKAFNQMGLKTVFGEVYCSNESGVKFWSNVCDKYEGYKTLLLDRKFWEGKFHDSIYFSINKENFSNAHR